eukprot:scaffold1355_cov268-Pinguiococcus_pyrenoidosus.AAC.14
MSEQFHSVQVRSSACASKLSVRCLTRQKNTKYHVNAPNPDEPHTHEDRGRVGTFHSRRMHARQDRWLTPSMLAVARNHVSAGGSGRVARTRGDQHGGKCVVHPPKAGGGSDLGRCSQIFSWVHLRILNLRNNAMTEICPEVRRPWVLHPSAGTEHARQSLTDWDWPQDWIPRLA